jgi:hypothetical protein
MAIQQLPTVRRFDCPRTCPKYESVDACRFGAVFAAAGVRRVVNSHTVTIDVKFSNVDAFAAAVAELGGKFIGRGSHNLFGTMVAGFGATLPNWRYPIVAKFDGSVAFDNYNGKWGDESDVNRLRSEYAIAAAKLAAEQLGWQCERAGDGSLIIFHPNGGTLTVDASGAVDANGFNGVGCHDAASIIGAAIGKPVEFTAKAEFYNAEQRLTAGVQ